MKGENVARGHLAWCGTRCLCFVGWLLPPPPPERLVGGAGIGEYPCLAGPFCQDPHTAPLLLLLLRWAGDDAVEIGCHLPRCHRSVFPAAGHGRLWRQINQKQMRNNAATPRRRRRRATSHWRRDGWKVGAGSRIALAAAGRRSPRGN